MSDPCSRVELMSHVRVTPVESLFLYRLESFGFSAEALMIKTDMTSDLLSVYFCLALLPPSPPHSFVLYSGEIVGVRDL